MSFKGFLRESQWGKTLLLVIKFFTAKRWTDIWPHRAFFRICIECTTLTLISICTQVSQNFWVESLNEVQPVITSLLVPDKTVEFRFIDHWTNVCLPEINSFSVHHKYTMQVKHCFSYKSSKNCWMRFKPICISFIWCLIMVPLLVREIFFPTHI